MVLDSLLYPLRLNADISLCGGGAAMLQQPLHKGNIVTVKYFYFSGGSFVPPLCLYYTTLVFRSVILIALVLRI